VFFLDKNRGWVVGSRGTLLATTNGGVSWQLHATPTADIIRDINYVDENNGWLVCERNVYDLKTKDEPRTYLMHTTDGGANWTRVDIRGIDVDARLTRALFSSRGHGWTFGEGGLIFSSKDNGDTWTRLVSPTRHLLLGGIFVDEDRGWLVGAGATIIQTADGGETWHQSRLREASEKGVRFAATSFVDNRLGWAVGSGGTIYRTINGGRTWQLQDSGVNNDLFDVRFLDRAEGWVVGAEGMILHTTDGGLHWTMDRSGTEHPLERVFFVDRSHGWAVGFGGIVLAYVRTGAPRLSGQLN
jgi:photosystem II stability/assembly factor-like uncharacterized protein